VSFRSADDNGLLVAWLGGFSAPSWIILALNRGGVLVQRCVIVHVDFFADFVEWIGDVGIYIRLRLLRMHWRARTRRPMYMWG
jgi:hypothetical protein